METYQQDERKLPPARGAKRKAEQVIRRHVEHEDAVLSPSKKKKGGDTVMAKHAMSSRPKESQANAKTADRVTSNFAEKKRRALPKNAGLPLSRKKRFLLKRNDDNVDADTDDDDDDASIEVYGVRRNRAGIVMEDDDDEFALTGLPGKKHDHVWQRLESLPTIDSNTQPPSELLVAAHMLQDEVQALLATSATTTTVTAKSLSSTLPTSNASDDISLLERQFLQRWARLVQDRLAPIHVCAAQLAQLGHERTVVDRQVQRARATLLRQQAQLRNVQAQTQQVSRELQTQQRQAASRQQASRFLQRLDQLRRAEDGNGRPGVYY